MLFTNTLQTHILHLLIMFGVGLHNRFHIDFQLLVLHEITCWWVWNTLNLVNEVSL